MGNGFPIGGIIIAPHIKPWHGMLGTTFGGNHLACAAAIAVLDVFENERLLSNASIVGAYLKSELLKINELKNVRGEGLMLGFDVPEEYEQLRKNLLEKHFIFTGEAKPDTIRLLPALNINTTHVDELINAIRKEISLK
jgi:acetylornithine aminotransferase